VREGGGVGARCEGWLADSSQRLHRCSVAIVSSLIARKCIARPLRRRHEVRTATAGPGLDLVGRWFRERRTVRCCSAFSPHDHHTGCESAQRVIAAIMRRTACQQRQDKFKLGRPPLAPDQRQLAPARVPTLHPHSSSPARPLHARVNRGGRRALMRGGKGEVEGAETRPAPSEPYVPRHTLSAPPLIPGQRAPAVRATGRRISELLSAGAHASRLGGRRGRSVRARRHAGCRLEPLRLYTRPHAHAPNNTSHAPWRARQPRFRPRKIVPRPAPRRRAAPSPLRAAPRPHPLPRAPSPPPPMAARLDAKHERILRALLKLPDNRRCADCDTLVCGGRGWLARRGQCAGTAPDRGDAWAASHGAARARARADRWRARRAIGAHPPRPLPSVPRAPSTSS